MTDEFFTDLALLTAAGVDGDELLAIEDDPGGTPATKAITVDELAAAIVAAHNHDADYEPLDADLTAIAALATTSFGRSLLTAASASALRTTAGVVIGGDVQAYDADLSAIGAIAPADDDIIQRKAGVWSKRTMSQLLADLGALGKFPFPVTQIASAGANDLDDYEEGTWTPTVGFDANGDLSIPGYTRNIGRYLKLGKYVWLFFDVLTSGFTHTTATGGFRVLGVPFTPATFSGLSNGAGAVSMRGWTKANFTQLTATAQNSSQQIRFRASGSGQTPTNLAVADVPTGGTIEIIGAVMYEV